jgi:hypothetical protein
MVALTKKLILAGVLALAVLATPPARQALAADAPTAEEVEKFKDTWNDHLKEDEEPLTTQEAQEMIDDYQQQFPDMTVDQIISNFAAANPDRLRRK